MRITRLLTLFALIAGITLVAGASPAAACSCMEPSDEQSFEFADAVFVGAIVEVREDPDANVFIVRVDTVFKGEVTEWQSTTTPRDGAACGTLLPTDTPVVLFGYQTDTPEFLSVGLCDPNRSVTATEVLFPDVEPSLPSPGGQGPDGDPTAPEPVDAPSDAPEEELRPEDVGLDPSEPASQEDLAEVLAQQELEATGGGGTPADNGAPWLLYGLIGAAALVFLAELARASAAKETD